MASVKIERWEPVLREEIQTGDRIRSVSEGVWSHYIGGGHMGPTDHWFERLAVEEVDLDPDDGHIFTFQIDSIMSSKVEGDPHNTFADWRGVGHRPVSTQGFNLRDAIEALMVRPIQDFFWPDPLHDKTPDATT